MASLKMVLEAALNQLGIKGADPSACRLLLKDKPLDLSLPVRFANIPAGSKLVLLTGEDGGGGGSGKEIGCLIIAQTHACILRLAINPTNPAGKEPKLGVQDNAAPLAQAPKEKGRDLSLSGNSTASRDQSRPDQVATPPRSPGQHEAPTGPANVVGGSTSEAPSAPMPSSTAGAKESGAAHEPSAEPPQEAHPSSAVFGQTVYVYNRSAEASGSADRDEEELPDEFYEFTEADLHRVLAAQATSRVREAASAVLKTKEVSEGLGGQDFGRANIARATESPKPFLPRPLSLSSGRERQGSGRRRRRRARRTSSWSFRMASASRPRSWAAIG